MSQGVWQNGEERQEVGISQGSNEHQFMARGPFEESGAFKRQLRLVVADGHFDLPAPGISQDDLPGELGSMSRFRGEEIPGRLVLAASHNQPEGLLVSGIENRKGNDAGFAFTLVACIPEHAVIPRTLGFGDLTGCAALSVLIQQSIVFGPAQEKTSTPHKGLGEPRIACKAAIPNMQDFLAPELVNVIKNLGFFGPHLAGGFATSGP